MHLISASRGFRVCTKALEVRNERRKLLEAAWACLGGGCDRPVSVLATVPFLSFSVHFLKFAHCGSCSAYEGKGKEEAGNCSTSEGWERRNPAILFSSCTSVPMQQPFGHQQQLMLTPSPKPSCSNSGSHFHRRQRGAPAAAASCYHAN